MAQPQIPWHSDSRRNTALHRWQISTFKVPVSNTVTYLGSLFLRRCLWTRLPYRSWKVLYLSTTPLLGILPFSHGKTLLHGQIRCQAIDFISEALSTVFLYWQPCSCLCTSHFFAGLLSAVCFNVTACLKCYPRVYFVSLYLSLNRATHTAKMFLWEPLNILYTGVLCLYLWLATTLQIKHSIWSVNFMLFTRCVYTLY